MFADAVDDALATAMEQIRQTSRQTRGEVDAKGVPQRAEAVRAHGSASLDLRSWQPGTHLNLSYAGHLVASATKSLPAELDAARAGRYPRGRRLGWATPREALRVVVHRRHLWHTGLTALIIGTILFAINHLDTVLHGAVPDGTWIKIGVTYLVPFAVANVGLLLGSRRRP